MQTPEFYAKQYTDLKAQFHAPVVHPEASLMHLMYAAGAQAVLEYIKQNVTDMHNLPRGIL